MVLGKMRVGMVILAVMALNAVLFAQSDEKQTDGSQTSETQTNDTGLHEDALNELRDTIQFGIDEEVRTAVERLEESDVGALNEELLARYADSYNGSLKRRILEFFNSISFQGAAETAVSVVENFRGENTELVTTAVRFLRNGEITLPEGAADALLEAAERGSGRVSREAIRTLGRREIQEAEPLLVQTIQDRVADQATKEAAILALGRVGSANAVGTLLSVAQNAQAGSLYRGYAIQSLGKVGSRGAEDDVVTPLRRFLSVNDAIVRSYATQALLEVDEENRESILSGALRDSLPQTRLNALEWIRENGVTGMSRAVRYKVGNDPDPRVRAAAMETLGELGTENYGEVLAEIALDVSKPTDDRMSAMKTLFEKQPAFAVEALQEAVQEDLQYEPRPIGMPVAQVLSEIGSEGLAPLYRTLLTAGDYRVRLYALAGIERNDISGLDETLRNLQAQPGTHPAALQTLERILGPPPESEKDVNEEDTATTNGDAGKQSDADESTSE